MPITASAIDGTAGWFVASTRSARPWLYGSSYFVALTNSSNEISVWRSTDGGSSWSQVAGSVTMGTFLRHYDTYADGAVLYIPFWDGALELSLARFDMAAVSWLSTVGGGPALGSWTDSGGVRCAVRSSDGSVVIVFRDIAVSNQARYVIYSSGWGSAADLRTAAFGTSDFVPEVCLGASDRVHAFWLTSGGGNPRRHRSIDSGGSLGSLSTVASDIFQVASTNPVVAGGEVFLGVNTSRKVWRGSDVASPSWTMTTPPVVFLGGTMYLRTLAAVGSDVYCFWNRADDYLAIDYAVYSGGAWGSLVQLYDGALEFETFDANLLGSYIGIVAMEKATGIGYFLRLSVGQGPANRYYAV
jgi:hypothetical protein